MSAYTPAQVAALTLMLANERTGFPQVHIPMMAPTRASLTCRGLICWHNGTRLTDAGRLAALEATR